MVFFYMKFFFSKIIFINFSFFHIELVENFASYLFSLKHCRLLQCFPICFFFATVFPHMYFFKIIFVEFFFNIELVENLALTFPTCFFFHLFLLFFPQNCLLLFFIFLCFFSELFLLILFL